MSGSLSESDSIPRATNDRFRVTARSALRAAHHAAAAQTRWDTAAATAAKGTAVANRCGKSNELLRVTTRSALRAAHHASAANTKRDTAAAAAAKGTAVANRCGKSNEPLRVTARSALRAAHHAAAAQTRWDTAATRLLSALLLQTGVARQCPTLSDGLSEQVLSSLNTDSIVTANRSSTVMDVEIGGRMESALRSLSPNRSPTGMFGQIGNLRQYSAVQWCLRKLMVREGGAVRSGVNSPVDCSERMIYVRVSPLEKQASPPDRPLNPES